MLPHALMGPQCPDWNLAPRRCPVHKCLLGENQEAGKGKGGREEGKRWKEQRKKKGRKGKEEGGQTGCARYVTLDK